MSVFFGGLTALVIVATFYYNNNKDVSAKVEPAVKIKWCIDNSISRICCNRRVDLTLYDCNNEKIKSIDNATNIIEIEE